MTSIMIEEKREKFFNALMRRTYTRRQAEELLEKSGIHDELKDTFMTEAEAFGLIDDVCFAKLFIEGHLHWGNLKIAHELSMRGISRDDISAALDEAEDEADRAVKLVESWQNSGVEDRKIISRLQSRGFTNSAVRSIMK